jgi:hypothetical protein
MRTASKGTSDGRTSSMLTCEPTLSGAISKVPRNRFYATLLSMCGECQGAPLERQQREQCSSARGSRSSQRSLAWELRLALADVEKDTTTFAPPDGGPMPMAFNCAETAGRNTKMSA